MYIILSYTRVYTILYHQDFSGIFFVNQIWIDTEQDNDIEYAANLIS